MADAHREDRIAYIVARARRRTLARTFALILALFTAGAVAVLLANG